MSNVDFSPISNINLLSVQGSIERTTSDAVFFLILSGALDFRYDEGPVISAHFQDVLLFTPKEHYTVNASGSNMVLAVFIRSDFFAQGQSELLGKFVCNSVDDRERDYSPLRKLLSQLALTYYENMDINGIHQRELAYSLLYYLNRYHYVPQYRSSGSEESSQKYAKRYAQIVSYIEQNYSEPISLEDLANEVYLSPTYLSRFFHKHMGENFRSYLNRVRLSHACFDLTSSDMTLTAVSYNNGFPNLNTFNQLFQAQYGVTPGQYRTARKEAAAKRAPNQSAESQHYSLAERTLNEMAAQHDETATIARLPNEEFCRVRDVRVHHPITPIWNVMINVGGADYLRNYAIQSHIKMFQNEIGFRYGRLESVLSERFIPSLGDDDYNFSNFDYVIQTLLAQNLTPFLDLTARNNYLLLKNKTFVYPSEKMKYSEHERRFHHKTTHLLRHCLNTFGATEVERWGFEVGYHHGEYLQVEESPSAFVLRFSKCYRMIKDLMPNALVGGVCHNISISADLFRKILVEMDHYNGSPDFISLCAFPYENVASANDPHRHIYSSDPQFISKQVHALKQILAAHPNISQKLYLTVFGTDIMARNPLSDTCFQASYLIKNTFDLMGLVDMIGYWQISDSSTEYTDSNRMLFGGSGIISKHGLKKPGFTALKRLNMLSTNVIQSGDSYIVTTNGRDTYHVMVCNYIHFSDMFCVSDPASIVPEDAYTFFNSLATKDLTIQLGNLPKGRYRIVTTTLNRDHGSLLDEWLRYGVMNDLQMSDIHYFQDIVHPNRLARSMECTEGSLDFHVQLLPHEVKLFEISREY